MKKLFLALFCVFFMVSCGSDSPDDVVKNYFEALFKGDVKKASQYVETDGEDMEMIQAYLEESSYKFLNKTNKQGGFKNTEIINSTINKDKAAVRFQINFKSGQSILEDAELYQKDGKWYLPKYGYEQFIDRHITVIQAAEILKATSNLGILINDLISYYLRQEKLANNLKEMTDVKSIDENGNFYVYKYPCLKMSIEDKSLVITNNNKDNNRLCTRFMQDREVIKILKGVNLNKKQSATIRLDKF